MKKVVIVTDRTFSKENCEEELIKARLDELTGYGIEWKIIEHKLEGMEQFSAYASSVEKKGPNSVAPCDGLLEEIKDAYGVITSFSAIGRNVIAEGENLKFIGVMRSGVEAVDIEAAREKNIAVVYCPGRLADPVADYTVALILEQCRSINYHCTNLRNGIWVNGEGDRPSMTMKNVVVGLLGFGAIGKKISHRLKAFGTKVIACDPFCPAEIFEDYGVQSVSMEDLLRVSDVVSVHVRMSKETENLIGKKEFAMMKSTAVFINTARAGIVNYEALLDAIKNKQITGAALDVFHEEPLPANEPLLQYPNVTLTPHRAGVTCDTALNTFNVVTDDLKRLLEGKNLVNQYNQS